MFNVDKFITRFGGLTEEYTFYEGQVTLHYDPVDHVYLLLTPEGLIPQDGVTNVCHVIDKSNALVPWAVKMMSLKLFATTPMITMPDGDKYVPMMKLADYEALVIDAKKAHKEHLEDAGDIGHIAHAWIENVIKLSLAQFDGVCSQECLDRADPLPENEKSRSCCHAAIDWMRAHNVLWIHTERKIYSRRYRYAGTMDGLCTVDSCSNPQCCPVPFKDRLTVADWKTSNNLYIEYLLQTAAYEQAYEEEFGVDIQDRWVIRLGKLDAVFDPWHLQAEDFPRHFQGFLNALELTRDVKFIEDQQQSRDRIIKDQKKAVAKAERDAALKLACSKADKFQGHRFPKCNDGPPCETCLKTYEQFQALKLAAKEKAKADKKAAKRPKRDLHEDGMKVYELMFMASLSKPCLMLTDGS